MTERGSSLVARVTAFSKRLPCSFGKAEQSSRGVRKPAAVRSFDGWADRPRSRPALRKLAHPELPDEVVPKAVVALFLHQREARSLVDAARGDEHVVRPQHDPAIARASRE